MSKIFICYRRLEDEWAMKVLCAILTNTFGEENVFRDVDGLQAGDKWKDVLETKVRECDVMLAIVGPNWLTIRDDVGRRRIDRDDDWVRFEIETALRLETRLVPVLLHEGQANTRMPTPRDLPDSLREFADCQAVTLRPREFDLDVQKLIGDLKKHEEMHAGISKAVETFDALVEAGEWVGAKVVLDDALVNLSPTGGRRHSYKLLTKRQPSAKLLHGAVKAFERSDFACAQGLLAQVPESYRPDTVVASMKIAEIGSELGNAEAISPERVRNALDEVGRVSHSVRGGTRRVPGQAELLRILEGHEQKTHYEAGVRHYTEGRFASAARCFERAHHGDSAPWLARIQNWSLVFDSVRRKHWSDARAHMRSLRDKEDEMRVRAARQWCLLADKFLPALTVMAEGGRLAEPAVPWEGGKSPYAVLGVFPSLPHAAALELLYQFANEKPSCDALRVPEKRLLVDFSTYAVRNPDGARKTMSRYFDFAANVSFDDFLGYILRSFTESEITDGTTMSQHMFQAIEKGLGDDAGILFALLSNYDAAIQRFLDVAHRNPGDHIALHHLGLAACAKAHLDPESAAVGDAWNLVCAAWGAVFADDRFWNSWWAQRRKVYPVTENAQVQEARSRLQRFWLDELKVVEGLGPDSADAFALEIRAARAVGALKGIVVGGAGHARAVVGRRGLGILDLQTGFHAMVCAFSAEDAAVPGPQRNVCISFSRLALPQSMIESGRHADAIAALERITPAIAADLESADIGFTCLAGASARRLFRDTHAELLRHAHLELAVGAVSRIPVDVDGALAHWDTAVSLARGCNCAEEVLARIRDVVVGRARALRAAEGSKREQLNCLDDAVRLIEEVEGRGWDNHEQILQEELVAAYLDRAVYVSNQFDMEKEARGDALAAYKRMPDSLRAIHVLCVVSLHYAKQLSSEGKRAPAADLTREVILLLSVGEKRFPGNTDLANIRENAMGFQSHLDGSNEHELDQILANLRELTRRTKADDDPVDARLEEAKLQQEQSHYEVASDMYWALLQENPSNQEVRGRMCRCYRIWLDDLNERNQDTEIRRVVSIARKRCADSLQLREVFESIEEAPGEES